MFKDLESGVKGIYVLEAYHKTLNHEGHSEYLCQFSFVLGVVRWTSADSNRIERLRIVS